MRSPIIATSLILALALSAAPRAAAAAAPATQTIAVTFTSAQFNSLLGGTVTGNAAVDGSISNGEIGTLRGTANFPLRDPGLTIQPASVLVFATQRINVQWQLLTCETYFCTWTYGTATYERQLAQGPVEIRLGSMRGNGTLAVATDPVCVASCPPPGAYTQQLFGFSNLNGGVVGSQDGGTVQMWGPAPFIR